MNPEFDAQNAVDMLESVEYKNMLNKLHSLGPTEQIQLQSISNTKCIYIPDSKITLPNFVDTKETLNKLHFEKRKLLIQYYKLYDRLIHTSEYKHKDMESEFSDVHKNILEIDNQIDKITMYMDIVSSENPVQGLKSKVKTLETQLIDLQDSVKNDIWLDQDIIKKVAQNTKELHETQQQLHKASKALFLNDTFYIDRLPKISKATSTPQITKLSLTDTKEEKKQDAKKETKKPTKAKKTVLKKVSNVDVNKIKENVKSIIAEKMKFKSTSECVSQKRSQPYYMSKENIIKAIESDSELKAIMPSNYKALSKEDICKLLFDEE